MAPPSKRESTALSERLAAEPYRFDFYQAVRIFHHIAWHESRESGQPHQPIGMDYSPNREVLRFRSLPSHRFPTGSIGSLNWHTNDSEPNLPPRPLAELVVPFLGLTGPSGVLPRHYTQMLIDRIRAKDYSLRDFLDLFHHRLISLFYRAWQKHRFYIQFEEAKCRTDRPRSEDLLTRCLYCLVGLGFDSLRNRLRFDDVAWLYYAGHFAQRPPSVIALTAILEDYFGLNVEVRQFQGQWLYLSPTDQSRTPDRADLEGQNNLLGTNVVVGEKVWSVENRFRLRIGPVDYQEFLRFMPTGDMLTPISQAVRSYAGPEFDFDLQPVLLAEETPWCRLGDDQNPSYLGWNTWLRGDDQEHDVDDAVFEQSGDPVVVQMVA
jgi:type VI secretion system protein ImpH